MLGGGHGLVTTRLAYTPGDGSDEELAAVQEEARLRVLTDRRKTVRGVLRTAEGVKNFRIKNSYVPELNESGEAVKTVTLRVGGRAALVSALGLNFATDNPQLAEGLEAVLAAGEGLGTGAELGLFVAAWTVVKVFCIDFGGVALALASGILFGGVWQGAVVSAFSATVGSSVAFGLAKMDTPARTKALELVEEYPSLRGIERVVAKDGIKAILTLRLAPVLPIPIGLYNYVYGVTNVPFIDFCGGIFLGSLKPYLLDSYIGVFGKSVVDGSAAAEQGGMQDVILLVALGVSVLIGIFASQLANETFESIRDEVEAEKAAQAAAEANDGEIDEMEGITTEVMGMSLPQFLVGFQLALKAADGRVNELIDAEFDAAVWNFTDPEELEGAERRHRAKDRDIADPRPLDPSKWKDSPEIVGADSGFDFGENICEGLVLSPALLGAFLVCADPLYKKAEEDVVTSSSRGETTKETRAGGASGDKGESKAFVAVQDSSPSTSPLSSGINSETTSVHVTEDELLFVLQKLRTNLQSRLNDVQ